MARLFMITGPRSTDKVEVRSFEQVWDPIVISNELSERVRYVDCAPRTGAWLEFVKVRHSWGGLYVHSLRINGHEELIEQPEEYKAGLFGEYELVKREPGLKRLFPTRFIRPGERVEIGFVNDAPWPVAVRMQWQWLEMVR